MQTQTLTLQFHTPAFLGDANRSGRWRTPPFKAQLRQWWRVAYAMQKNYAVRVDEMRQAEGLLFGHAWLKNDIEGKDTTAARKSKVLIRLSSWSAGSMKDWPKNEVTVKHLNVAKPVGAHLYMGYGPLTYAQGTSLKANAAIQAKENAELSIAYPEEESGLIETALHLMHLYGTVGGRSRNAWGSYSLDGLEGDFNHAWKRTLNECMRLDWPHAVAADNKGALVWQTKPHKDWASLMTTLAKIKIALRTQFSLSCGNNAIQIEDRQWLSYPVTNHSVKAWGNNARLPNQLRFKVRAETDGQLVGVIFHMPHLPPTDFNPKSANLLQIWQKVYTHLDTNPACPLTRIKV
jgi:CRISPR-associated protein Cmr1